MTLFDAYVAPARVRPGWWRILIGILFILVMWVIGTVVVLFGWLAWNIVALGEFDAAMGQLDALMAGGGSPAFIVVMLMTFVGVWFGVWIAMAALHGQRFMTVFAPGPGRRPGGFVTGVLLALAFVVPTLAGAMLVSEPVRTETTLGTWALWIVPFGVLIFVQAVGEELIFRGYMQQQLAARCRHWLVWAVIPSVLFGLLHFANAETLEGALLYTAVTFLMGLILAVTVWRTGSLWTASGIHWGNNLSALVIIGPGGTLSGAQIWSFPKDDLAVLMWVDLAAVIVVLALVLSPLGRLLGDGRDSATG